MLKDKIREVNDSYWLAFLEFFISIIIIVGIWLGLYFLLKNNEWQLPIIITFYVISIILTILIAELLLIAIVRLYRLFAPQRLRNRCRYTPTCSVYMIVSLRKYGAIVGLYRGIKRILRCHPPYGGVDEP